MIVPLLIAGCSWGEPEPRSVIAAQTRRAAEVDVQTHVTGDQPARPAAPTAQEAEQALALAALGYIDEGEVAAPGRPRGTAELDAERSAGGISVFTVGGKSGAVAVDMAGAEVHRWAFSISDAWPGFQHPEVTPDSVPWRRIHVLDSGDLIGIWSGYGIVRITAGSELLWGHWLPVHHDLHVFPDESILTLTSEFVDRPDLYPAPIAEEHLTWLSADGYPTRSLSLLQAFEKYPGWPEIWANRPVRDNEDIFHANTVYVLEQDATAVHPEFKAGRILTSMRHLDAIALVDPEAEAVVWAQQGGFKRQHDPQLAADGGVWVFDNQGAGGKTSRMIKLDPRTGQIQREWRGDAEHRLWTRTCGHAQQLSNGNLLVVSSEQGVVYELAPEDEVVWTYHVSDELGAEGQKRVARFFGFQRIEPSRDLSWVRGAE